jgi:hypothetical protein
MKSHPQKNTLLKNADANAASNFFKRVFFSPTQKEFFPPLFFLFFSRHRTGFVLNSTDRASKVNHLGHSVRKLDTSTLRTDRRASGNRRLAKKRVQCLNEALCFVSSSVLADSLVLRNPLLRQSPKR